MEGECDEQEMNEKILETDPRNVEALKVTVYGKIRRGKCKEAEKFVKRLIDKEPNEVEWRLLLALCYETMGYLSKAKGLYLEILENMPLLVRALHVMFLNLYVSFCFDGILNIDFVCLNVIEKFGVKLNALFCLG